MNFKKVFIILFLFGGVQHPPHVLGMGLAQLHAELGAGQGGVRRPDIGDDDIERIHRDFFVRMHSRHACSKTHNMSS